MRYRSSNIALSKQQHLKMAGTNKVANRKGQCGNRFSLYVTQVLNCHNADQPATASLELSVASDYKRVSPRFFIG